MNIPSAHQVGKLILVQGLVVCAALLYHQIRLAGLKQTLKAIAKSIGAWSLAIIILFEEWGWDYLARVVAAIGRLPILRSINAWIAGLPPYGALAAFAIPILSLLPFKVGAIYLIANGHKVTGIVIILCAKVVGTAITAHLFSITRNSLMKLQWFAKAMDWWIPFKNRILEHVKSSPAWMQMASLKMTITRKARGWAHAIRLWMER